LVAFIPTFSQSDTLLETRDFIVVTRTPEAFELHLLSRNGVPVFFFTVRALVVYAEVDGSE